ESKQAEEVQQKTSPLEEPPPSMDEVDDIIKNAKAAVTADTELNGQFDQLFEHLEHEIKDLPAITTMAVFSLGVLFGRLLR
ncbi:MAG: hypothetical protein KAG87_02095, partial [Marinobacter adhaerens]|nr:hypothetical protein [Marinobacter adhaerens]